MNLEALLDTIPAYANDLKLNLTQLLKAGELSPQQTWGTAVASAITVEAATPVRDILRLCREHQLTRLPVWTGTGPMRRIVGVVSLRTLLYEEGVSPDAPARQYLRPALYFDDSMRLEAALRRMQRSGQHFAVVLGPNRRETSLVTLWDIGFPLLPRTLTSSIQHPPDSGHIAARYRSLINLLIGLICVQITLAFLQHPDQILVLILLMALVGSLGLPPAAALRLVQELERIAPAEVLRADANGADMFEETSIGHNQRVPEWHFEVVHGHKALLDQLGVSTLSGFGADGLGAAFGAAGALLRYAQSTQGRGLQHVKSLAVESESEFIGQIGRAHV